MHSCNPPDLFPTQDIFWVNSENDPKTDAIDADRTEFSITELSNEFGVTHRALRFYENRGLLMPQRQGRQRIYSRADRERLALILKGKRFGFTLAEISGMIEAQAGRASEQGLKLTSEKCLEQIAFFERQLREAGEALAELRRIHLSLCVRAARHVDTKPAGTP